MPTTTPETDEEFYRYVHAVPGLRHVWDTDPMARALLTAARDVLRRVELAIRAHPELIAEVPERVARMIIREVLFDTAEDNGPEALTARIKRYGAIIDAGPLTVKL